MLDSSTRKIESLLASRATFGSRVGSAFAPPSTGINFTYGYPDADSFPINEVIAATQRMMQREGRDALQYGPVHGFEGLLDYLIGRARRIDQVAITRKGAIITSGSSQAIDLLCAAFIDPGDTIIVEAPSFLGALRTFRIREARLVGVPVDDEGMQVDRLAEVLQHEIQNGERVKFIYCLPNFHNPAGVTLSLERRRALVELAHKHGVIIMEDDAYEDLRYDGEPLPSLLSIDGGNLVVKLGTFSKTLAAGMRLGWAIGNEEIVEQLALMKVDTSTNPFAARVAAQYISMGLLDPHIEDLITLYRGKRDAMVGALAEFCPPEAQWTKPAGGFYCWIELPARVKAERLASLAAAEGVTYLSGVPFYFDNSGHNRLRLAFSLPRPAEIREGVKRLGRAIQTALRTN